MECKQDARTAVHMPKTSTATLELWHRRLGHANTIDILTAQRKGTLKGIQFEGSADELNCHVCLE